MAQLKTIMAMSEVISFLLNIFFGLSPGLIVVLHNQILEPPQNRILTSVISNGISQ